MNNRNKKVSLERISAELTKFINELEFFDDDKAQLSEEENERLASIKEQLSNKLIKMIRNAHAESKQEAAQKFRKVKEIILNVEILPFQLATRSTDVLQHGTLWRHDGGQVRFKIQIPHDKLEIYSPKGEFITSFPVSQDGEAEIKDLEAGVYCVYLRGRRVVGME